jgi:hypothetical protein
MSIFISYEWTSKNIVHKVVKDLEAKYNQKTWIDLTQMRHGTNLDKEIQTRINDSEIVAAFVTLPYCKVVLVEL